MDSKNISIAPCLVGITTDLLSEIKNNLKDDPVSENLRLYFVPNNANQGYFYKPFRKMNKFKIEDNLIYYNNLIYIPENFVRSFLQSIMTLPLPVT